MSSRGLGRARTLSNDWQALRWQVAIPIKFREGRWCQFAGEIEDISLTGCRMRCVTILVPGAATRIMIDGFEPFQATVARNDGDSIAVRFTRPLHAAVLRCLIERYPPDKEDPVPAGRN